DRHNTLVAFELKPTSKAYHLVDDKGASISLQLDGTSASFVLRDLEAGQSKTFRLVSGRDKSSGGVELARVQNRLEIKVRGHQVFSFVAEPGSLPSPDI